MNNRRRHKLRQFKLINIEDKANTSFSSRKTKPDHGIIWYAHKNPQKSKPKSFIRIGIGNKTLPIYG